LRDLAAHLRLLGRNGGLSLPPPGAGSTSARHTALFEFGRSDLSVARLAEAHIDAMAIFVEAGHVVPAGRLYGVWASDGPGSSLTVSRSHGGKLQVRGTKRYCSGAQLLDAALVTAHDADDIVLLNVSLTAPGLTVGGSEWASSAFAGTNTASISFDEMALSEAEVIGPANWYLTRPGFWHGALGPAACWAGGAAGLVDAARALNKRDPHARAQLGALEAADWGLRAVLEQAAREIDSDPTDTSHTARRRALMARHLIERLCTDVLDRFGRATGPQLLAFDAEVAQRHAELSLYIRQCHAERDLESIPQ
jgi:alkylation response protein AidB-like acyl-CoA dehydrogenase